jgi:hypothetical protein
VSSKIFDSVKYRVIMTLKEVPSYVNRRNPAIIANIIPIL